MSRGVALPILRSCRRKYLAIDGECASDGTDDDDDDDDDDADIDASAAASDERGVSTLSLEPVPEPVLEVAAAAVSDVLVCASLTLPSSRQPGTNRLMLSSPWPERQPRRVCCAWRTFTTRISTSACSARSSSSSSSSCCTLSGTDHVNGSMTPCGSLLASCVAVTGNARDGDGVDAHNDDDDDDDDEDTA